MGDYRMKWVSFMKHSSFALTVLLIVGACAAASTSRTAQRDDPARLRMEIDSLNRAMIAAFDSAPSRVARFYSDSARIVGPRRRTVSGRQSIDQYWASITGPAKWTLDVVEVGGSHSSAYQVGVSRLTSAQSDGTPATYVCDFVVLWRRQSDGTLRITLDLYN